MVLNRSHALCGPRWAHGERNGSRHRMPIGNNVSACQPCGCQLQGTVVKAPGLTSLHSLGPPDPPVSRLSPDSALDLPRMLGARSDRPCKLLPMLKFAAWLAKRMHGVLDNDKACASHPSRPCSPTPHALSGLHPAGCSLPAALDPCLYDCVAPTDPLYLTIR